ncbi:Zn(II)2Cys6 transcription factor [Fusarium globosum]|uniref:Zn(II)2Cys6 transcription factor n=1 Tax=Fusarium globosum TaxID=78864 RepID=A0A8H5YKK7_9HYPO|nr:Zn(II)2Cys6 transcription factor [Fusarium globosum]
MINDYEQRVEDMASRLPILQAKFEDLRSASVQNQIDLRSDLASKVSSAVDTLTKLAQLICGQPERFSPHPEIKVTMKELNSSWKETNKAAKNLLDNININYINIADFNNVSLGRWYNQAVNLQAALRAIQKSTKKEYRIEKSIQLSLFQARRDAESHVHSLQQTLDEAQSEYDGLDQLALNPTIRRMTLQRFEHAMAICTFDLSDAKNAVQTAIEQGSATEQRLREQESTVREINNLVTMQADLVSQGSSLLTDCSDLMGSVEHAEDEISCIKIHHFRAWQLINRLSDRSESAEFALSKAACASCILMVIDTILDDHTLTARLTEMVQHLANDDDSEGCIRGIITGDYPNVHPQFRGIACFFTLSKLPLNPFALSGHGQDSETPSPGEKITHWMCYQRNRACNISSARFRVYNRASDPQPATAQRPSKSSEPDPIDNSCRNADEDALDRSWHLFIGNDSTSPDLDVAAETPSVPSPISNAVYDTSHILVRLASLPRVHPNEAQPHLAIGSNSITAQSEVPRRDSNIPEPFDFIVSPSSFGTDESLPHLPAMVAAHALTPSDDYTNARARASTNLIDQKSEIVETDPELSFFLRQFADTMGNWMDLFDMDRHYHRVIPMLAWSSPLLLYSACAVAAKQLTLVEPSPQELRSYMEFRQTTSHKDFAWYSTKYYDRAISLLLRYVSDLSSGDSGQEIAEQQSERDHNPKPCRNEIIIAATILSVYEFLTASDQTWSEHLDGIRSFIRLSDELGFNFQPTSASLILDPLLPSLLRAACWNFARQDFLAACETSPSLFKHFSTSLLSNEGIANVLSGDEWV